MIVVDASVLTDALTDDTARGAAATSALGEDDEWAGPEHLVIEVAAAVRGRWLGRRISEDRARAALDALGRSVIERLDTAVLLPRIWELRSLTTYDAAYVAAAEALDVALLTADDRVIGAPGRRCRVITP